MPGRRVRTTVALPADLLAAMDAIVRRGVAESRNSFLEKAVRAQLAATRRARVDAEFTQMASDPLYQEEATQIAEEFATADWEALRTAERDA